MAHGDHQYIQEVIESIRHEFVEERNDIPVRSAIGINGGYCRVFAEAVIDSIDQSIPVKRHTTCCIK